MTFSSDFRLYHSNSLELLAQLLAQQLRKPAPGASVLDEDIILIPQAAMKRWLQATLATQHGVAANLRFLTPGEFVRLALDANIEGAQQDLDAAIMQWQLFAQLNDTQLLQTPLLTPLRDYLQSSTDASASKRWALAGALADVFEKYQAWRRQWLLQWEKQPAPEDAQALLWQQIAAGKAYRGKRIDAYLKRFFGQSAEKPQGLPARLFVFAVMNVSPDVLRVIASQAQVGTLHFYMPSPCAQWWGDLRSKHSLAALAQVQDESRLLQSWGVAGREFMALLGSYEVVHPRGEIDAHVLFDDTQLFAPQTADAAVDLQNGLLKRLQADIANRRGAPRVDAADGRHCLPKVRKDDVSLQVHACHTPLRELQVLHAQLRQLLDDTRFNPPLQPREIAVLAPDIDVYMPYLQAVFGHHGQDDFIPWTVADTSALASEPLAEVFLQLLHLPLSRFSLDDVLDLLANPALAAFMQLPADSFEQLRHWLVQAGAYWGLDAQHRAQHQAPQDDAYTWQFAIERLLMGHASGSDAVIAGVAGWPQLEGQAMAALDQLLRMLQLLAKQQQELAQPRTAEQWRTHLLGLLQHLFADVSPDESTRRALQRLRNAINTVFDAAACADVTQLIDAQVVRDHFEQVLTQADTRAPLLTGGISFARMVPMRLLPFRVICVLGMNDGDYPRRDANAGLNKLAAQWGTQAQQLGDRSLRDDDRFLFLQLLCAAQDVFYVSYQGAHPRDGSVREPSQLLGELLDEAAAQHVDSAQARKDLVVMHPLQPFAQAAFGDSKEPRRFSYRNDWHEAAAALLQSKQTAQPWHQPLPNTAAAIAPEDVQLSALQRFFRAPAQCYLEHRLGLRLADELQTTSSSEPQVIPKHGLDRYQLQQYAVQALMAAADAPDSAQLYAQLRARALLPSSRSAALAFADWKDDLQQLVDAMRAAIGQQQTQLQALRVVVDGVTIHGVVPLCEQGIVHLHAGKLSGNTVISQGLAWLLANAAGVPAPLSIFHYANDVQKKQRPTPAVHQRPALAAAQAKAVLAQLMADWQQGLQTPLLFAPYTSWAVFTSNKTDMQSLLKTAREQWQGGYERFQEGALPAHQLLYRDDDWLSDTQRFAAFVAISQRIFSALQDGVTDKGQEPR